MRAITRKATFASIGLMLAALLATGLGAPVFPGVGSLSSFAVGDDTITLSGAADATRRTDAVATVVARS